MKRLRHILQSKHLIKIITIIIFIITLLYTNYYPFKSKYTKDDKEFIGIVTKYEVKEDKITIEIKAKEKLLITYKYQDKEFNNLSYGDKIKVKGTLITPSKNTNQNTFNYQKYLYYTTGIDVAKRLEKEWKYYSTYDPEKVDIQNPVCTSNIKEE